jgi:Copper amine oxidase N-terminal domain.
MIKSYVLKVIALAIGVFLISTYSSHVGVAAGTVSYTSPEGIIFSSSAPGWSKSDLADLYQNFITNNQHGEELKTLNRITVVAGNGCPIPEGIDTGISGCYASNGEIILNYGETWHDGTELNLTLSHEYGHHFSYYWLHDEKKWSKLRGIEYYPVNNEIHYDSEGHYWSIHEIMADDYATLYGDKRLRANNVNANNGDMPQLTKNSNGIIPDPTQLLELQSYLKKLTGLTPNGQFESAAMPHLVSFQPENHEDGLYYRIEFSSATTNPNKELTYFISVGRFADKIKHTGKDNIVHFFKESIPIGNDGISYLRPASDTQDVVRLLAFDESSTGYVKSPEYYYNFKSHSTPFPVPFTKKIALEQYGQKYRSVNWEKIIGIQVFIHDIQVNFPQSPIIVNGSTLVPLRACFELLGADVDWNNQTRTAIATKGDTTLNLEASKFTTVNGSMFVPLRFVSEFFEMNVKWDGETNTVYIT